MWKVPRTVVITKERSADVGISSSNSTGFLDNPSIHLLLGVNYKWLNEITYRTTVELL